ncbi:hypothetical protein SAMN05421504_101714 [Amycolatopsis xylanica]|uniref:Uncharacterized protein n=1 Tax=Amycolatopsis xylanica TaxID=589385 RepID=A0A1H2TWW2_9PSEU|nr:hypothetical protein [Amycolatopsis xylanica]SDW48405.1 hypothetical protein SAMN05421504_101714 [Amycolatopsis xylanica]
MSGGTKQGRLSPYRSALLVLLQVLAAFVVATPAASPAPVRGITAGTVAKAEAPGFVTRFTATAQADQPGHTPIDLPPGTARADQRGHAEPAALAPHREPATTGEGPVGGRAPPSGNGI